MGILRKIGGFVYFGVLSLGCLKYPEIIDYVEVNGQRLLYAVRGPENGRPVVLLHGNGGSHKSLLTQAKQLARAGYRVYSPDSRGQGANPPLDEYHYSDMAEDSYCFIKAMGLEKPAVYGWSDGGILALMIEMEHPGTCGYIAISGANLYPDCGPSFEEFKQWILDQGTPLAMMMLNEPDINPSDLNAIKCPTLVTAGSKDLISEEHTKLIADNIPGSELVIVPGATHSSFIKKNPRMGRLLIDFLNRNSYINNI